jgi:hypothetical protein
MIMIEDINKDQEPNMEYYYNLRKQVRNLYQNDVRINPSINDLCSQMLHIRDKNKCVESIDLNTSNYTIEIGLDDTASDNIKNKIYNEATNILDNYIKENVTGYEKDNTKYEKAKQFKLYDEIVVGNSIKFIL